MLVTASVLVICMFLGACASTRPAQVTEPGSLVWPDPPQTPRIAYKKSIRYTSDIAGEPSWLGKVAQGLFGRTREKLLKPYGIATDNQGRIYVTDTAARVVHRFDLKTGKTAKYDEFVPCGEIEEQGERSFFGRLFASQPKMALASPIGIAVDSADNFYVSDSVLQRVFAFDQKGRCLRVFGNEGNLPRPSGVAINNRSERLYVTDTANHTVVVYSLDGDLLFTFGKRGDKPGEFNFPTNVFIDNQGRVFVTDSLNFRVQIFSGEGEILTHFGELGNVSGTFNKPKGIAVDSDGNIYVVDSIFDNVQIFNYEGHLLLTFGESGQAEGEFWLPSGIFIDADNNVYVSDSYNTRIQIFKYLGRNAR